MSDAVADLERRLAALSKPAVPEASLSDLQRRAGALRPGGDAQPEELASRFAALQGAEAAPSLVRPGMSEEDLLLAQAMEAARLTQGPGRAAQPALPTFDDSEEEVESEAAALIMKQALEAAKFDDFSERGAPTAPVPLGEASTLLAQAAAMEKHRKAQSQRRSSSSSPSSSSSSPLTSDDDDFPDSPL